MSLLVGHGFSRAAITAKNARALAPEVSARGSCPDSCASSKSCHPDRSGGACILPDRFRFCRYTAATRKSPLPRFHPGGFDNTCGVFTLAHAQVPSLRLRPPPWVATALRQPVPHI